jgi:hypothetical protein
MQQLRGWVPAWSAQSRVAAAAKKGGGGSKGSKGKRSALAGLLEKKAKAEA